MSLPWVEDSSIWASVEWAVREVLLPELTDPWARQTAQHVVGLAAYARTRSHRDRDLDLDAALEEAAPLVAAYRGQVQPERASLLEPLSGFLGEAVVSTRRVSVGASRAMHVVTLRSGRRVMVRIEQGGVFGTTTADEVATISAVADLGIPVPPIVAVDLTGDVLGQPFFVMDFVDGNGAPDDREADDDFVATLQRLHDAEPPAVVPAGDQVGRWERVYRASAPGPVAVLERAAAWLRANAPVPPARLSVVHGDPGPGNYVHVGPRVAALTDWEFAHVGDPAEDWVFCLCIRGARYRERADWLALYERVAGVRLTPQQVHYWEAFNVYKGACANLSMLRPFVDGTNPAPNMAIIGVAMHGVFLQRLARLIDQPSSPQ